MHHERLAALMLPTHVHSNAQCMAGLLPAGLAWLHYTCCLHISTATAGHHAPSCHRSLANPALSPSLHLQHCLPLHNT